MMNCPRCRHANFDGVAACARCDLALLVSPSALTVPMPMPMPGPMIEPVFTPVMCAGDEEPPPFNPALAWPFGDTDANDDVILPADSPRWVVPGDPHGTHASAPDELELHVVGGPQPSCLVPPGTPMNESVVQAGNATIPATDRADQAPTTPPPPSVRPKLVVLRGMKIGSEYPVYEGRNTVGRFADKPVDIDLVCQESTEQIWCSRQHAIIVFEKGNVLIEDLNSLNGTWVNGVRIHAGQSRQIRPGDVVQIGTVQMKLVMG
jgi:hypothetical protein